MRLSYAVSPTSGCWRWTGKHARDGRPIAMRDRETVDAARYLYERACGAVVLDPVRTCATKWCVNPEHHTA